MTAPLLLASALLVLAGAPKTVRPALLVGALRTVGLHVPGWLVRAFGAGETLLGLACLARGGTVLAALVAASYAGFSAFLVVALAKGGAVSSCGCLGRPDTPPTRAHLLVTAALGVCAAVAAAGATPMGASLPWSAHPLHTAVILVVSGLALWLVWLVMTELPHLTLARAARSRS